MSHPLEIDFDRIRQLAQLARSLGLSELTSEEGGVRVTVTVSPPMTIPAPSLVALTGPSPKALPSVRASKRELTPEEQGLTPIAAPMMGIFYRSSSPDTPPYVEVGSRVEEGDVVGLIEAMKVFNEITAEVAGEVVSIPVSNEELVNLGQPLVWVRP